MLQFHTKRSAAWNIGRGLNFRANAIWCWSEGGIFPILQRFHFAQGHLLALNLWTSQVLYEAKVWTLHSCHSRNWLLVVRIMKHAQGQIQLVIMNNTQNIGKSLCPLVPFGEYLITWFSSLLQGLYWHNFLNQFINCRHESQEANEYHSFMQTNGYNRVFSLDFHHDI